MTQVDYNFAKAILFFQVDLPTLRNSIHDMQLTKNNFANLNGINFRGLQVHGSCF